LGDPPPPNNKKKKKKERRVRKKAGVGSPSISRREVNSQSELKNGRPKLGGKDGTERVKRFCCT